MTKLRDDQTLRRLAELDREERELVVRALRGDRAAFDSLFDRYFDRMVHCFRDLPEGEAQGRVADALARLFSGLSPDDAMPLAGRAREVAVDARKRNVPIRVRRSAQPVATTPRR